MLKEKAEETGLGNTDIVPKMFHALSRENLWWKLVALAKESLFNAYISFARGQVRKWSL